MNRLRSAPTSSTDVGATFAGASWMIAPTRYAALARVTSALSLMFATYAGLYRIRTYDTFFHLAAGRYLLAHGALPPGDPFSFTYPGAAWLDHSPLFQLLIAKLHVIGGYAALSVYQALCAALLVAVALWTVRLEAAGARIVAALLMAAACIAFREVLEVRPHVVGFLALALCAWQTLEAERAQQVARLAWIPIIYLIWVQSHGSHLLIYPLLMLGAGRTLWSRSWRLLAGFALVVLGCLAALFWLAPHALHQGFAHVGSLVLEQSVSEWRALTIADLLGTWPGALFTLAWLSSAGGLWLMYRGATWSRDAYAALLLIGTLALALTSRRMLPLFLFGCAPIWLPFALRAASAAIRGRTLPLWAACLGVVLSSLALWVGDRTQADTFRSGVGLDEERVPIEAVQRLRETSLRRVYNAYNYGGYLMLEGVPVFVDGRSITVYPAEFVHDFQQAYSDPSVFERLVARFACDGALLPVDSLPAARLRAYLAASPSWRLVYGDKTAVLYARR